MAPANENTTAHQPSGSRWAVLRSEAFWRGAAGWSAVIFATVVGTAVIGFVYWTGDSTYEPPWFLRRRLKKEAVVAEAPPVPPQRRAMDGTPLADGLAEGPYAAVLIDNMAEARPYAGVAKSPLVIEAPVEGGITRLLAFFPTGGDIKKIGPVRSVRPYYLDWAQEYDSLLAHVGGSPEALERIKSAPDIRDLNQFFNGDFFWRSADRTAPHNVYTSAELLAEAADKRFSAASRPPSPWLFKEPSGERKGSVPDLDIDFSSPAYRVVWVYDAQAGDYVRRQGGKPQSDEDGAPVRARNIVVQYMKVRILDEIGRRRITTIGSGKALVVRDGEVIEGTWHKQNVKSRTRFLDEHGQEIVLNAGTTWIEVVPEGARVTYSSQ
jgi:hypothetical protein